MRTEEQQREYDSAMEQEAMSQGEYLQAAVRQHSAVYGAERPDDRWVLSPFDTWENNPCWNGTEPYQPHPEDEGAIEAYYFVGPPQPEEEEEEVELFEDFTDEDLPF